MDKTKCVLKSKAGFVFFKVNLSSTFGNPDTRNERNPIAHPMI